MRLMDEAMQFDLIDGFRGKAVGQDFQSVATVEDFENVLGRLSGQKPSSSCLISTSLWSNYRSGFDLS